MAVTINYTTYVISVPKADTTFVEINPQTGLEIRELNVEDFGKALADVQDDQTDVWAGTAFEYTAVKDVGGVLLAPVLLILSPYTITFEDGQYAVNLVGGNQNISDVVNVNQVSIRSANSAGLIQVTSGSGVLPSDVTDIENAVWQRIIDGFKAEDMMKLMAAVLAGKVSGAGTGTETFRGVNDTKDRVISTVSPAGNRTNVNLDAS